jgi:hypothetical protein
MKLLIGIVFGVIVGIIAGQHFTKHLVLEKITSARDAVACASLDGIAAMVAPLGPDGQITEGWQPACLRETR